MSGRATVAAVLAGVIVAFVPPASGAAGSSGEAAVVVSSANAYRQDHRVATVGTNAILIEIAARQANRMRDAGYIFHNPNVADELSAATPDWSRFAENVGEGPTVQDIAAAFIASPSHEDNIVDARYNAIGVAVATNGEGRRFVAEVFARFEDMTPARHVQPAAKPAQQPRAVFVPVAYFPTACAGASLSAEDGSRVQPGYYGLFGC